MKSGSEESNAFAKVIIAIQEGILHKAETGEARAWGFQNLFCFGPPVLLIRHWLCTTTNLASQLWILNAKRVQYSDTTEPTATSVLSE